MYSSTTGEKWNPDDANGSVVVSNDTVNWELGRELSKFFPSYGGDHMWVGANPGAAKTTDNSILDCNVFTIFIYIHKVNNYTY